MGKGRKTEKRTVTETITGMGAGMATGAGTGNMFDPSNAGYPLLVFNNCFSNTNQDISNR
jgi:hypothetical protein